MSTHITQYLSFNLGKDRFALEIAPIREIIEYPGLTGIPMTPSFMRGVINLRGSVVPVIDLSARFGREPTDVGRRTCVVIVEVNAVAQAAPISIGILVDGVNAVMDVESEQVEGRPEFGLALRADFIRGMIKQDGRFMVILDVDRILATDELEQLVGASASMKDDLTYAS